MTKKTEMKTELERARELVSQVDHHGFVSLGSGVCLQTEEDIISDLPGWEESYSWLDGSDYYITTDSGDEPIGVNTAEEIWEELKDSAALKQDPELQWLVSNYFGDDGRIFGYYASRESAIDAAEDAFKGLHPSDQKRNRYEVTDLHRSRVCHNHGILVEHVTDVIDADWMKHSQASDWDNDGIAVLDTTSDEGDRVLYSLDNCYDIFGRCLGYPLPFEQIERVFDELWHQRKRWTFDQIQQAMYAGIE